MSDNMVKEAGHMHLSIVPEEGLVTKLNETMQHKFRDYAV